MAESIVPMGKKTRYKLSFYINIVLFFIIALCIYLLVVDCLGYSCVGGSYDWLYIARDLAFLSISLALVFFQFFRNLLLIWRRSL